MSEPFRIEVSAYCRDDGVEALRANLGPQKDRWVLRATDGRAFFFKPAGLLNDLAPSGSYGEWVFTGAIRMHEMDPYYVDFSLAMALLGVIKRPV